MKKIIFSQILTFGLLLSSIPIPLYSSSWGERAMHGLRQGASSFYSAMPNFSQYMPSSPQWVTTLLNRLPEDKKWVLFTALAGALGLYGYSRYRKSGTNKTEDKPEREFHSEPVDIPRPS